MMINYTRGETMDDPRGNTVTMDKMFSASDKDENPYGKVCSMNFNSPDYKSQIWPLEAQIEKERKIAEQYDELCAILQKKLSTGADHNSRAEEIKARMRKKLEAKKKNLT
jgi:hypothetical protein